MTLKRILILFLFTLPVVMSYAQEPDQNDRWRIGVFYSMDRVPMKSTVTDNNMTGHLYFNSGNPQPNFRLGAEMGYRFWPFLDIVTGLNYEKTGFEGQTSSCPVCHDVYKIPDDQAYLAIPITLRSKVQIRGLTPFADIGVVNRIGLPRNNRSRYNDYIAKNKVVLFGRAAIGVEYFLTDQIGISVSGDYTRNLTNIYPDSDYRMNTYGLRLGVSTFL